MRYKKPFIALIIPSKLKKEYVDGPSFSGIFMHNTSYDYFIEQ
ncbi:hypothetical protein B4135_4152 [Caldibacillus debilis]|uniref:Uncharacterized protein n=1 Tax=Caldibacillus debilis TaxID=301148 RepID=A0A150L772_9BACI|nr:hypothetical protein B4135_4152 [Caldibacillus debilis]